MKLLLKDLNFSRILNIETHAHAFKADLQFLRFNETLSH